MKLNLKVPEESWCGRKPGVKRVPDARRSKLEDKSEIIILIGYH
jgi:hypothetical protein